MQPTITDLHHLNWLKSASLDQFKGRRILDLGCGGGYICHKAMESGALRAVGIDVVRPKSIEESSSPPVWQFESWDLNSPDWHHKLSDHFDLILAFDIIEHLDSPYNFLRSCACLLDDSGHIIVTTPNSLSWERYVYPESWSGATDPQHKTLFTKYSLSFLLQRSGFVVKQQKAPLRALSFLGALQPQIGGQLMAVAQKNSL